ncbi:unnamed protein product [Adineta steineri]|uniref:Mono(ADP-ribosyl)transferase n=1 Tax=Adineta steineri TaxID=433720 RepID=A0A814U7Y9_9BILA|nr:unnamed protein product [Adineta steineri]CAF4032763.1 unnamed protein product [Adineta steineri]
MGSAGSVNKKPRCPYRKLLEAKLKKAKLIHGTDKQPSDLYLLCEKGETEKVRKILEGSIRKTIDDLVKLEPNGSTALHIATKKGHVDIVRLLLEHRCSRTILNCYGKEAYKYAATPDMQNLFIRSETSSRFFNSETDKSVAYHFPTNKGTKPSLEFLASFETEDDVQKYSLDFQTTAMWLRLFNWFSRTFPSLVQNDNLNLDTFNLYKNDDFKEFLKLKLDGKHEAALDEFDEFHRRNSIESLLRIYSNEEIGFYQSLNRQLADSPQEYHSSPHLCDRFIIEFHLRSDELAERRFLGTVYRGATINSSDLLLYEKALETKPRGVITFKAFTSTSEDINIALKFMLNSDKPFESHQIRVLYIIKTEVKSPTIVGIADVSEYPHEEEVLFMPGNLFVVKKLVKDVTVYTEEQKCLTVTEIHLEYLHIPISFWKKLLHTYRSANNSVTNL